MDLSQAISYPFDDAEWVSKLAMTALLTFAAIALMPLLFVGLVPLCVLLGYSLEIIDAVRRKADYPMPRWTDFQGYLARGAGMLPALIVYNLPLIFGACCLTVVRASLGSAFLEGVILLAVLCCLTPLILGYILYTWPMLANATAKYARGQPPKVFFEVGKLTDAVNAQFGPSMQLALLFVLVNVGLTALQLVPVIGQLLFFALYFPIMAHLIGQYARIMETKDPHRKRR